MILVTILAHDTGQRSFHRHFHLELKYVALVASEYVFGAESVQDLRSTLLRSRLENYFALTGCISRTSRSAFVQ